MYVTHYTHTSNRPTGLSGRSMCEQPSIITYTRRQDYSFLLTRAAQPPAPPRRSARAARGGSGLSSLAAHAVLTNFMLLTEEPLRARITMVLAARSQLSVPET